MDSYPISVEQVQIRFSTVMIQFLDKYKLGRVNNINEKMQIHINNNKKIWINRRRTSVFRQYTYNVT